MGGFITSLRQSILHYWHILIFLIIIFISFIFIGTARTLVESKAYFIIHSILYILGLGLLIFLLLRNGKKFWNEFLAWKLWEKIFLISIFISIIIFVFVLMSKNFDGRFANLIYIFGNVFVDENFRSVYFFTRTYSMIPYSILSVIGMTVTPLTVLYVNKIVAVIFLFVSFLISRKIFKSTFIAIFILITLALNRFVQMQMGSIEYSIVSAMFVSLSIFFLIRHSEKKRIDDYLLAGLCVLLAAFNRYELSFLYGLPFLFYSATFVRGKQSNIWSAIVALICITLSISVITNDFSSDNVLLLGDDIESFGLASQMSNSLSILNNNLFINHDMSLFNHNISIEMYFALIVSLLLAVLFIYRSLTKKKHINPVIYLMAAFFLFYFIFQIAFNMDGMRANMRYLINYAMPMIILAYYPISWVLDHLPKKIMAFRHVLGSIFVIIIISVSVWLPGASMYPTPTIAPEVGDMMQIIKDIDIDDSCTIISIFESQPRLHLYTGLQQNAIYLGRPPEFYQGLSHLKKNGCFYYYDEYFLVQEHEPWVNIDVSRIDDHFNDCERSVVLNIKGDRPSKLLRYDC